MEHILTVELRRFGVCSMKTKSKPATGECPVTSESVGDAVMNKADDLVQFCQTAQGPFGEFEQTLAIRLGVLGCCLTQLFLAAPREKFEIEPFLEDGRYCPGEGYAE